MIKMFLLFKSISLAKGQHFIEDGKTSNWFGILIDGLLIAEVADEKGERHVKDIYSIQPENMLLTSYASFARKIPSGETITAMENSRVLVINETDFHEKLLNMRGAKQMLTEVLALMLSRAQERSDDLLLLDNKQLVEKFIIRKGVLYNRLSKTVIASYLGIHRNHLTRILKQLKKNN